MYAMNDDTAIDTARPRSLLEHYRAIEQASADMLAAARHGDWEQVMCMEQACALMISELKAAADQQELRAEERKAKAQVMQRILLNDAEIRYLAEPWLEQLDRALGAKSRTVH